MAWVILFIAGLLECGWTIGLKYTDGLSRPIPLALTAIALISSFGLLTYSLRTLPVGSAYAVWTGMGAVGTAVFGILLFGEAATALRLASITLVVAGIAGLKLAG